MVALGNKTEPTAYFSLRPDQGNANGGNGKMWSSRAKEESKALTIKEKLKRKMQQQLKKTFKVSSMDLLQN